MKPLFLPCVFLLLAACASVPERPLDPFEGGSSVPPESAANSAMITRGAAFAAANCVSCHAIGATGDSPRAMAPAFRDIGKRYPVRQLSEAFAEGIVTAHPDMPEFVLTPDDNRALIAYLESVQADENQDTREGT
jgi:mono/diheme cytochrome c family protein